MTIRERMLKAWDALLAPEQAKADTAYTMPSLWSNYLTGLGGTDRDRTAWHAPGTIVALDDLTLSQLWQGDPIAKVVIEAIVDDGMRAGFQIAYHGEEDHDRELVRDVSDAAGELDLEEKARLAAKAARALYGSGILLVVNGGRMSTSQPLKDERVVSVDHLITFDSRDMQVQTWTLDEHSTYTYTPQALSMAGTAAGATIDSSHVVVFPGVDTTIRDRQETWLGWYRPVLQHVVETIRDYRQSWQSTVAMLQDGSQGVLSLPDLARTIATVGRSVLETRLSLIQLYRWTGRIMPIDAGSGNGAVPAEKFEWVERSFAGIAELLREHQPLVAQAAEMPITRLFGRSPAGLNATGVSDERAWYATVQAWRRAKITPALERIVRIIAKANGATDWTRWGVDWPELEVLSSAERAALEKAEAETDSIRVALGMPEEVILRHRYGGGAYTHEPPLLTEEDLAAMEAQAEEEEARATALTERLAEANAAKEAEPEAEAEPEEEPEEAEEEEEAEAEEEPEPDEA